MSNNIYSYLNRISMCIVSLLLLTIPGRNIASEDVHVLDEHSHHSLYFGTTNDLRLMSFGIDSTGESALFCTFLDTSMQTDSVIRIIDSQNATDPFLLTDSRRAVLVYRQINLGWSDDIMARVFSPAFDSAGPVLELSDSYDGGNRANPEAFWVNDSIIQVVWRTLGDFNGEQGMGVLGRRIHVNSTVDDSVYRFSDMVVPELMSLQVIPFPSRNRFVCLWRDNRTGAQKFYHRIFAWDATPVGGSRSLVERPDYDSLAIFQATRLSDSTFAIAFSASNTQAEWGVYWKAFRWTGDPINIAEQVNPEDAPASDRAQVVIQSHRDGRFVVTWQEAPGEYHRLQARIYSAIHEPQTPPFYVSSRPDTANQVQPDVLIDSSRVYTVWLEGSSGIWGRMYSLLDPPVGVAPVTQPYPKSVALYHVYPNPFNQTMTIRYRIEKTTQLQINVYALSGTHVRQLYSGRHTPGVYSRAWDGTNTSGKEVGSGMYFINLKTSAGENSTVKAILIK